MGDKLNDFTKSNQRKLSPADQEKARTEPHPADETAQPRSERKAARKVQDPATR